RLGEAVHEGGACAIGDAQQHRARRAADARPLERHRVQDTEQRGTVLDQIAHAVDRAPEPLPRIAGLEHRVDDALDPRGRRLLEDRSEEPFLAVEVPVERGLHHAGVAADVVHAGRGVAALGEATRRGAQQPAAAPLALRDALVGSAARFHGLPAPDRTSRSALGPRPVVSVPFGTDLGARRSWVKGPPATIGSWPHRVTVVARDRPALRGRTGELAGADLPGVPLSSRPPTTPTGLPCTIESPPTHFPNGCTHCGGSPATCGGPGTTTRRSSSATSTTSAGR